MRPTSGIIIIGDEILSGMVQDQNAFFMAGELKSLGVALRRIVVTPDEIEEIAKTVKGFSEEFDYVFTSGGVGPTHDDVTIEGVSRAFGVRTVPNAFLLDLLAQRYGEKIPRERRKTVLVPEGAELIKVDGLKFPLLKFRNVYIFPGIPKLLREKFTALESGFQGESLYLKKVSVDEEESQITALLNRVVNRHNGVKIGSYPVQAGRCHNTLVTFESLDKVHLQEAIDAFVGALPVSKIIAVD
jgi:molybdenum cofactor synthesis domain-containing protein